MKKPVHADIYKPSWILKNGHINTMYAYLFRTPPFSYHQRERFITADGDFYDVDYFFQNNSKIAVLLHGMEGSSHSQYTLALSRYLSFKGWDIACINLRSCSGELNKTKGLYHSAFTVDLNHFLQYISPKYEKIHLAGFSLGGNIALHYAGNEYEKTPKNLRAIAAVSVPVFLSGANQELKKAKNRLYCKNFLITLSKKIKEKALLFPNDINTYNLHKIKTLEEFDDSFTAPLHGFNSAADYYQKASSLQHFSKITIPTLLINAMDDSFLSKECYPAKDEIANPLVSTEYPRYGGHVGFANVGKRVYWTDRKIKDWFDRH
jgi:uncharacterized protein